MIRFFPLQGIFLILLTLTSLEASDPLLSGDRLYTLRENIENVHKAKAIYLQALDKNPAATLKVELLWRISMTYYYIGHRESQTTKKKDSFKRGIDHGEKCLEISRSIKTPMAQCYFWSATNLALYHKEISTLSLAFNLSKLFDYYESAGKLDPTYAHGGPYRMLAILYQKTPGFFGGDKQKALEYITKAIELAGNEPMNYFVKADLLKEKSHSEQADSPFRNFIRTYLERRSKMDFEYYESRRADRKIMKWAPKS